MGGWVTVSKGAVEPAEQANDSEDQGSEPEVQVEPDSESDHEQDNPAGGDTEDDEDAARARLRAAPRVAAGTMGWVEVQRRQISKPAACHG